jgi:hypothetical protein
MPEDPSSGDQNSFLKSGLTAVTLLSTLMTIALGIGTYLLNVRVGQAEQVLKARAQKLEEARADVARYNFVFQTLSNIDKGSSVQRTLAVNTARLVLKAEEQETLFNGLSYSKNEALADAGRQGVAALSRALTQARPTFGKEKKQEQTKPSPAPEERPGPPIVPQATETPRPVVEPPLPPPEPILSAATVVFHTNADDKDKDAAVSVTISSGSSVLFTWQETSGEEEWKPHSDKTITLQRVAEAPRSLLANAKITICLDREKKHGWKFNYTGKLWIGSEALSFGHKGNEIERGVGRSCLPPLGIG